MLTEVMQQETDLFNQVRLVTDGAKQEEKRVEIALVFIFPPGIIRHVVWKNCLAEFSIYGFPSVAFGVPRHKIVQTHILHITGSFRIECVHHVILKDVSGIWISLSLISTNFE